MQHPLSQPLGTGGCVCTHLVADTECRGAADHQGLLQGGVVAETATSDRRDDGPLTGSQGARLKAHTARTFSP